MANSHYYDRTLGIVVKRPLANPEKAAGYDAGRKHRRRDQKAGTYPREGLPISRDSRSALWIESYQQGYYQHRTVGRPNLGDETKVTISVCLDREIVEAIDSKRGDQLSRSALIEDLLINALCFKPEN